MVVQLLLEWSAVDHVIQPQQQQQLMKMTGGTRPHTAASINCDVTQHHHNQHIIAPHADK